MCNFGKLHKHLIEEECQPDAFTFIVLAHHIHTIVPITGTHERHAVLTESKPSPDCPYTVIIKTCCFFGTTWQIIIRIFPGVDRTTLNEAKRFVKYPSVPGGQNVATGCKGKPQIIIGAVRTHTPAYRGMPPMLDVSHRELAGCRANNMLTDKP